jgi:uncharacterized protein YhaN
MNLANLILENFGKFKNFECSFSPGLNVIKGANETGKSTLVEAISRILYDDPQTPGQEGYHKGKTWGTDDPLVIKAGIRSDDFTGLLEKDFDTGQVRLANHDLNIMVDDKSRINEILTTAMGFSSAELFEATSCIKQGEISQIGRSIKAIKDKLESLVTGGKEDQAASQIIARIDQRIENISRKDKANPGLIEKLETVQDDLDYNIEKINRGIKNLISWRSSIAQVETAYANGLDDYNVKKAKLDKALKADKSDKDLKRLIEEKKAIDNQLEKIKAFGTRIKELSSRLSKVVAVNKKDLKQIDEIDANLKYLKPKQKELEKEVEARQNAFDEFKIGSMPVVLMVISLGGVVFGIADFFMRITEFFYQIAGGGAALLLLSLFMLSRGNQKKLFLKEQLNSESKKLENVESEIGENTAELDKYFEKYKIDSIDETHQAAWKRSELVNQLQAERDSHDKLLDGSTQEEIEVKAQNIEKEIFDARIALENYEPPDPAELERLKSIVSQLEEQKNNLQVELKTLDRQIETAEGGTELLASYLERKEQASESKIKLIEELSILSLTKECIEKARQNVMISTLELLEKRTSEILEIITGGKYKDVKFDQSSLKFKVFSDEKKDWAEPQLELSQATIEQIYLTARLALTEILGDKAKPPIILDDTFDSFDPARHEGTMKLLKQMAEDRQILLLTSDDQYDAWADKTIQLT